MQYQNSVSARSFKQIHFDWASFYFDNESLLEEPLNPRKRSSTKQNSLQECNCRRPNLRMCSLLGSHTYATKVKVVRPSSFDKSMPMRNLKVLYNRNIATFAFEGTQSDEQWFISKIRLWNRTLCDNKTRDSPSWCQTHKPNNVQNKITALSALLC